ncbi:MAG: hypothetical protein D6683_14365 [Actinomyces sp.]|nr:MAG: hypothetical protein D6683_14365 [Actinomyces sp.]
MSTGPAADPALVVAAVELARRAGRIAVERFADASLTVESKADGSPVTEADRATEAFVRRELGRLFPDDGVIGEEHADTPGTSGRTWIVDPIDGTKAFTHGVPLWSTLVAVVDHTGPLVGVIDLPALGETVWAGRGRGAWHDGRPARVSDHGHLAGSYVCTSGFAIWERDGLERVLDADVHLRTWGDAYGYALVATGRAEAMIDPVANAWDLAPMAVIVPEAGGHFTALDGRPVHDAGSGLATNGAFHEELRRLVTGDGGTPAS